MKKAQLNKNQVRWIAYQVWKRRIGDKQPHDYRDLMGKDEILGWVCPQCGQTIWTNSTENQKECTVDWRWPLHRNKMIEEIEYVFSLVEMYDPETEWAD